jgi:ribose transport system ATP-binding protein
MTGIDKSFGGVPALRGADFIVGHAEVHALIGQNGAGKSTLIKVLTGYHRRDAGSIVFDDQPFEVGSPQQAQAAGISTIYQEINLVGFRSVSENICLGREPKRFGLIDWKRMHETARELLARFSIDIDVRRSLDSFSTATQQMVAIARALGFKAKLVIMDEPTSSLDDREVEVLFDVIRQIKREGVSVVFVSHKLDELYAVCDRVTIMRDGTTVRAAGMAEVDKLDLVATMLGRDLSTVARQGATAFGEKTHGQHRQVVSLSGMKSAPRVQDATLEVGAGEIVGLAGLLGAGRTETVRLLFGADHPDAGEIRLDGQPFAPKEPIDAIERGIGFCTEDRKIEGIVPELSVRENLTLALLPHLSKAGVVDEAEQGRIVERFIKRLGVKCTSPDQPIRELSGGNQQKVLLARWLCMNPKLLILDEPTRGIDVGAKAEIQSLIRELARDGLAVLMVSSEVEEIIEGSDRAYVMRDGRTVTSLTGDRLNEHEVLAAMAHGTEGPIGHG